MSLFKITGHLYRVYSFRFQLITFCPRHLMNKDWRKVSDPLRIRIVRFYYLIHVIYHLHYYLAVGWKVLELDYIWKHLTL